MQLDQHIARCAKAVLSLPLDTEPDFEEQERRARAHYEEVIKPWIEAHKENNDAA